MKTYHLHILATISVPEGVVENEDGRGWVLPDGTLVKPFVTLEKDETADLDFEEYTALGFDIDRDEIISVTEEG